MIMKYLRIQCFCKYIFRNICEKHSIQNWVDIENEYYRLLKDCLKESGNDKVKSSMRNLSK
jgi:hypothetical protein